MKLVPSGRPSAPEEGLFTRSQSTRMRRLLVALVLVISCYFALRSWEGSRRPDSAAEDRSREGSAEARAALVTPQVDAQRLRALALDDTPEQRVLLEPEALAEAFDQASHLEDQLFVPMGGVVLDASSWDELLARSVENRGRLFRARGVIEDLRACEATDGLPAHFRGSLRLEDGGRAAFAVEHEPGGGLLAGDFVRLDGLFVKVVRHEGDGPGGWIEAPLLVGPRFVRSWPRLAPILRLDPQDFAEVDDDDLSGIGAQPFDAFWMLVGYARDLPEGAVDWNVAPVLDREAIAALALDGGRFRGRPMRLPVSQVMESWIQEQPENPLRVERLSVGWLANQEWIGPTKGLVQFVSPVVHADLPRDTHVLAHGFFLKNLAYEPELGGISVAPFFVLHSLEVFTPATDAPWTTMMLVIAGLVLASSLAIFLLLRRDRRRSAELQEELRLRRQARQRAHLST